MILKVAEEFAFIVLVTSAVSISPFEHEKYSFVLCTGLLPAVLISEMKLLDSQLLNFDQCMLLV